MKIKILMTTGILLASVGIGSAQTPSSGGGAASGAPAVGSDVKAVDSPSAGREQGLTSGVANETPGLTPRTSTNAPVPNAAVSKPPADAAAPAGR